MIDMSETIGRGLGVPASRVAAVIRLFDEGATVPFIARYRKEATGGLDETVIIAIRDERARVGELESRRERILLTISEQGKLTPELERKIREAQLLSVLEDLYLPYRPKRRTRASDAREKGLEPLADRLLAQGPGDPRSMAAEFVDPEKGVSDPEAALAGAADIIAERVSEDSGLRGRMRELFRDAGFLQARPVRKKEAEPEAATYRDYFDWQESARNAPSHRVLAALRGHREGYLLLHLLPDEERALTMTKRTFVTGRTPSSAVVESAVEDGYRRLLAPSLENELLQEVRDRAEAEAIRVFARNLRELLLSPPLGQKAVMALDPGFRTGCKVVCLSRQGDLLEAQTIYPLEPQKKTDEASRVLRDLAARHGVEAIAVGNGTGGREAYAFCRSLDFGRSIPVLSVPESGASVYSASDLARREFPDRDVTVRGAVSIGRRLMDPLAELVKIDPKAIGVGQYQHDVDQKALRRSLEDIVTSCVNSVGVEANTASGELLKYVSGFGERLAGAFVRYREEHGPFRSRAEFRKVGGLGPKAFEQAAGFLRIREGGHPLDRTAVHPERYPLVERIARDLKVGVDALVGGGARLAAVDPQRYVDGDAGLPTIRDILEELARPGRDPRDQLEPVPFRDDVREIADLAPGMRLPGIVTNVTGFGAFVDIGVHQDGLVHVSRLADRFVSDPHEVVRVHQQVMVTVLEVDVPRKRISLSMRENEAAAGSAPGEVSGGRDSGSRNTRRT